MENESVAKNEIKPEQVLVIKQSWKDILKNSIWQRLLLFSFLFPLGLIAYTYAWAGAISALVNLSGDVGNVALFNIASIISLALVKPAIFLNNFISQTLIKITHAQYVDGYLLPIVIDAIYIFVISSIVVVLLWKLFSKIHKLVAIIITGLLWLFIIVSIAILYKQGSLKDVIGERALPINFYIEEKGYSWDEMVKHKEIEFAKYPKETIDNVLLKDPIAGFVSLPNDVRNNIYSTSSEFGKIYEKPINNKEKMGASAFIYSYSSTVEAKENLAQANSGFSEDIIDGNHVWRLKANWSHAYGSYIKWVSGRRVIDMSYGSPYDYDGLQEGEQFVKEYLKKYPSGDGKVTTSNFIKFEDMLDGLTFELPAGSQVYKSIDDKGHFVTAAKYDNNFNITTNPEMVSCCEGPVLRKYLLTKTNIEEYIKGLNWAEEIKSKKLVLDGKKKVYLIEATPSIASPYRVILQGTSTGADSLQVIELNMQDNVLNDLFNFYLKTYSSR